MMTAMISYLGPIHPRSRTKAHAVTEGVDEDKNDAGVVGDSVLVVGINEGQGAVDLQSDMSVSYHIGKAPECPLPSMQKP